MNRLTRFVDSWAFAALCYGIVIVLTIGGVL